MQVPKLWNLPITLFLYSLLDSLLALSFLDIHNSFVTQPSSHLVPNLS